jgi:hypothetical protein
MPCRREELTKLMDSMQLDGKAKQKMQEKLDAEQNAYLRLQRKKMNVHDFDTVAIIGRGAFGEVRPSPSLLFPLLFSLSHSLSLFRSFFVFLLPNSLPFCLSSNSFPHVQTNSQKHTI